jgi:hypothetical protein
MVLRHGRVSALQCAQKVSIPYRGPLDNGAYLDMQKETTSERGRDRFQANLILGDARTDAQGFAAQAAHKTADRAGPHRGAD